MLLNGCLNFGLGAISKSEKWFFKSLRRDPTNAEALSNLAIVKLALGSREDAEHYWLLSIKQAPSYLGAAEHLVGFLYDCGRVKDALRIIEFTESALRGDCSGLSEEAVLALGNPCGYAIQSCDNSRLLTLIHGKGNLLYQSGDKVGAAQAFVDAILLGTGRYRGGISELTRHVVQVFPEYRYSHSTKVSERSFQIPVIFLPPEIALKTAQLMFPSRGDLGGFSLASQGSAQAATVSMVSNSLLSLAKIYQDSMSLNGSSAIASKAGVGVAEVLALYYLSLSLKPSPSTANNVGILVAGIQIPAPIHQDQVRCILPAPAGTPGILLRGGIALAMSYYEYGLRLDDRHAHLYTNLGSLFKDVGCLSSAIQMYEKAIDCDSNFDIALANLANAVKDRGNIEEAIAYYRRAVAANPKFVEAVCGLTIALTSVCDWRGRGGVIDQHGEIDRWHVDSNGLLFAAGSPLHSGTGYMNRVIAIVESQLDEAKEWGRGVFDAEVLQLWMCSCLEAGEPSQRARLHRALMSRMTEPWAGARFVRLVERATKALIRLKYLQTYVHRAKDNEGPRRRPYLPNALTTPFASSILPFHTFTMPFTARQIRLISQANALRVSCIALKAPWLSPVIPEPPPPPDPFLKVGYVSSDFNNHPLAHLMQSVFGMHHPSKVQVTCYATTPSDSSNHRKKIEAESPCFRDCSTWTIERIVNQIIDDQIHILVNLNGYTRGAKNEVFAARPAPIQMSFMGFAGTLGAEWCDYILADEVAIPRSTLRPNRHNVGILDHLDDGNECAVEDTWVYSENIIFTRETFFCCDHKQSAPDAQESRRTWSQELKRRRKLRQDIFPHLAENIVILGNFNQLYKVSQFQMTFHCSQNLTTAEID